MNESRTLHTYESRTLHTYESRTLHTYESHTNFVCGVNAHISSLNEDTPAHPLSLSYPLTSRHPHLHPHPYTEFW